MEKTREFVPMKVFEDVLDKTNNFKYINSFYITLRNCEIDFILHSQKDVDIEKIGHKHDYYLSLTNVMTLLKSGEISKENFTKYVYDRANDFISQKREHNKKDDYKEELEDRIKKDYDSLDGYLIDTLSDALKLVEQIRMKKFFSFMTVNNDTGGVSLISVLYKGGSVFSYLELHGINTSKKSGVLNEVECANYLYDFRNQIKKGFYLL